MISELRRLSWSIDRVRKSDNLDKDEVEDCLDEILEILLKMNKAKIVAYRYSNDYDIVLEEKVVEGN